MEYRARSIRQNSAMFGRRTSLFGTADTRGDYPRRKNKRIFKMATGFRNRISPVPEYAIANLIRARATIERTNHDLSWNDRERTSSYRLLETSGKLARHSRIALTRTFDRPR